MEAEPFQPVLLSQRHRHCQIPLKREALYNRRHHLRSVQGQTPANSYNLLWTALWNTHSSHCNKYGLWFQNSPQSHQVPEFYRYHLHWVWDCVCWTPAPTISALKYKWQDFTFYAALSSQLCFLCPIGNSLPVPLILPGCLYKMKGSAGREIKQQPTCKGEKIAVRSCVQATE